MLSLDEQLRAELEERERLALRRAARVVPAGALDLASNDYLGLSRHPVVIEAACEAVRECGAGGRASRLVSGHTARHEALESELAAFKGCEAALVFASGYAANLSVITALARRGDVLLCDKRNHASLVDACRLAGASGVAVRYYGTPAKLRALLETHHEHGSARRLIVSDAVYSMDGDLVDWPALSALAREFGATVLLDDAHGTGTLGATGRGVIEHFESGDGQKLAQPRADVVQIGTLSKALGAQGGFVAGSRTLIEWLQNAARPFIYTTALSPAACGAALAALRLIRAEPQRISRLRCVTRRLGDGLCELGFDARRHDSPIIPVIAGDAARAVAWSQTLLQNGVWCPAIRPPTVPADASRLRVTASAALSEDEIDFILRAFASVQQSQARHGGS